MNYESGMFLIAVLDTMLLNGGKSCFQKSEKETYHSHGRRSRTGAQHLEGTKDGEVSDVGQHIKASYQGETNHDGKGQISGRQ